MIIYKYVSADIARVILENRAIRFTEPRFFNNPFDTPTYPVENRGTSAEDMMARIRMMGKNSVWARLTGILSLTRTPFNPLMWSHYAEEHRGMVIGIDAVRAGWMDEKSNLIPAQYGGVLYASRRPNDWSEK